jgi:hypothetical protein
LLSDTTEYTGSHHADDFKQHEYGEIVREEEHSQFAAKNTNIIVPAILPGKPRLINAYTPQIRIAPAKMQAAILCLVSSVTPITRACAFSLPSGERFFCLSALRCCQSATSTSGTITIS